MYSFSKGEARERRRVPFFTFSIMGTPQSPLFTLSMKEWTLGGPVLHLLTEGTDDGGAALNLRFCLTEKIEGVHTTCRMCRIYANRD